MNHLKELFQSLTLDEKNQYLWQLVSEDEKIRDAFKQKFFKQLEKIRLAQSKKYDIDALIEKIKSDAQKISEELSELDFEYPDWDRWNPPGYYVPEYEAAQIVAEEMADEAFEGIIDDIETALKFNDFTAIVCELLSAVYGVSIATIHDPYDNLGDPSDYFLDKIDMFLKEQTEKLGERVFLSFDLENGLELIMRFHQNEHCGELIMRILKNMLIAVIHNKEFADIAWKTCQKYEVNLKKYPDLLNQMTGIMGDKKMWVESMESVFLRDYTTSESLMEHYYHENKEVFHEKANHFFKVFRDKSVDFLVDKVMKGSALHIDILKTQTSIKENLAAFEKLKECLSSPEMNEFIESISNKTFQISLWDKEKMYDRIEATISQGLDEDIYFDPIVFPESIQFLYVNKPEAALYLTEKKINSLMKHNRKRDTYNYIANLLKQSFKIPGKTNQVQQIIKELYLHKPSLPALRDELRQAGLI